MQQVECNKLSHHDSFTSKLNAQKAWILCLDTNIGTKRVCFSLPFEAQIISTCKLHKYTAQMSLLQVFHRYFFVVSKWDESSRSTISIFLILWTLRIVSIKRPIKINSSIQQCFSHIRTHSLVHPIPFMKHLQKIK